VGGPSPEDWNKVRRYASWMRQLYVDEWPNRVDPSGFRLLSPAGGWFPALQGLAWRITVSNLPHIDLFFSPHLKEITVFTSTSLLRGGKTPPHIMSAITSAISTFPTSTLQHLFVDYSHRGIQWAPFRESFSSLALRCGPSLMEFTSSVSLSSAAINHLIHLPHLHTWRVGGPPPHYSASSLPLVFPPLIKFTLGRGATWQWFSLFERLEHGISATQGITPLSKMKGSLEYLKVEESDPLFPNINVSFIATIKIFQNLAHLDVGAFCYERGEGRCIFKLDNNDVVALAMALSQLESLLLGHPCFENTCATTATCLLPISVYCIKLQKLEIHFNTTNIVDDLKNISRGRFQELLPLPRCPLSCLEVSRIPLTLDGAGFETVVNWMMDIFPSLECCQGQGDIWYNISDRLMALRKARTSRGGHW